MSHMIYISIIVALLVYVLYLRYARNTEAKKLKKQNDFDITMFNDIFYHCQPKFNRVREKFYKIASEHGFRTKTINLEIYPNERDLAGKREEAEKDVNMVSRDVIIAGINEIDILVNDLEIFGDKLALANQIKEHYEIEITARRLLEEAHKYRQEEDLRERLSNIINHVVNNKGIDPLSDAWYGDTKSQLDSIKMEIAGEQVHQKQTTKYLDDINSALCYLKDNTVDTIQGWTVINWKESLDISQVILECAKKSIQENIDKRYYKEACEVGDSVRHVIEHIRYLSIKLSVSPIPDKEISVSA